MNAREVLDTEYGQFLMQALVQLGTLSDARAFLQDLLTVRELEDISQRLEVARMLDEGQPYLVVQKKTGASSTTVSRVSKCLNGEVGGYRWLLDRMDELKAEDANGEAKDAVPDTAAQNSERAS